MHKVTPSFGSTDSTRCYLKEIGRIPLLTHELEVILAQQVQQMMSLLAAKEALSKKLRREPTKSEWAAQVKITDSLTLDQILHQGQRAKQQMVAANLRLVVAIAKRYQNRGLELLDLVQSGSISLQKAAERFDPTKGCRFSTYAYYWCKQGIIRALADDSRAIRLPLHITEKMNLIKKISRQLTQQSGRKPSIAELAQELEWTIEQVQQVLETHSKQPISLNLLLRSDEDKTLEEVVEDTQACATQADSVLYSDMRSDIERLMVNLKEQEQEVLKLRFGWSDGEELSLRKVGKRLQLSGERVRQLENKALEKLRQQKEILSGY